MIRFHTVVIASVLLLALVPGCNNNEQAEENVVSTPVVVKKKQPKPKDAASSPTAAATPGKAQPSATPGSAKQAQPLKAPASPAKTTAAATADAKQTLAKLDGYLPAAVQALEANDNAKAKQYAKSFNDNWQQKIIQASVKNKSQDSFNKITAAVTQVNDNLIKPATPDKAKAIAAVKSLSQAVDEYTKTP